MTSVAINLKWPNRTILYITFGLFVGSNAVFSSPSAKAGAVVELRLGDLNGNPMVNSMNWSPGDQFVVEVWLKPSQDITVREMVIDFRNSDPEVFSWLGLDIDGGVQGIDGIPNFWFDYTGTFLGNFPTGTYPAVGLVGSAAYGDFSNLMVGNPQTLKRASAISVPGVTITNLITLTANQFTRIGGMPVTIPLYRSPFVLLDLLSAPGGDIEDKSNGSSITFGTGAENDPITTWSTAINDPEVDGPLTYAPGAGPFVISIPEPSSFVLTMCVTLIPFLCTRKWRVLGKLH